MYEGREYDFVFSVEIDDEGRSLKLPYNRSEDPWQAAQNFVTKHALPQSQLEEETPSPPPEPTSLAPPPPPLPPFPPPTSPPPQSRCSVTSTCKVSKTSSRPPARRCLATSRCRQLPSMR